MTPDAANQIELMRIALRYAKEKLAFYRAKSSGEYVGGLEYTALIGLINDALEGLSGQHGGEP